MKRSNRNKEKLNKIIEKDFEHNIKIYSDKNFIKKKFQEGKVLRRIKKLRGKLILNICSLKIGEMSNVKGQMSNVKRETSNVKRQT